MKILVKDGNIFTPNHYGIGNIILEDGVVKSISKKISPTETFDKIINCKGKILTPMFVDGHEHIIYNYRDDHYNPKDIINSGVGTLVGVLADEEIEKCSELVKLNQSKAKELRKLNIEAFYLAGSKAYRENIFEEIVNNPICIGTKTALNSPNVIKQENPTYDEFKKLALETYRAGMESNKKVQVHVHLETDLKEKSHIKDENGKLIFLKENEIRGNLDWIDRIVAETNLPYDLFKITHCQKFPFVSLEYAKKGVWVDFTVSKSVHFKFDPLIEFLKSNEDGFDHISISTDMSIFSVERNLGIKESPLSLLHFVRKLIFEKGLSLETVLPLITTNPAKLLDEKLGQILIGENCKLNILDNNLNIEKVVLNEEIIKVNNQTEFKNALEYKEKYEPTKKEL